MEHPAEQAPPVTLDALPEHPAPDLDPDAHLLVVCGEVESPATYRLADLLRLPASLHVEDFRCLEGWVAPDQRWSGIMLADVIERSRPAPDAAYVFLGADGFTLTLPLERAREGLLALGLNGEPLPVAHGSPVRFVLPGGDCFTSIKWLDRIELLREPREDTAREIALGRIGLDPAPDDGA